MTFPAHATEWPGNWGGKTMLNGFGRSGYGGPCPPPGDGPHRYVFQHLRREHSLSRYHGGPGGGAAIGTREPRDCERPVGWTIRALTSSSPPPRRRLPLNGQWQRHRESRPESRAVALHTDCAAVSFDKAVNDLQSETQAVG